MFKRFFKIGLLAALAMILAIPAASMAGPCDNWPPNCG